MIFPFHTEPARFLQRPNRFRIVARLRASDEIVSAHCPNPGRMGELLIPGTTVHLSRATAANRRTAYDLRFAEHPLHGQLISLNTQLPNALFAEGLQAGFFAPFRGHRSVQAEASVPRTNANGVTSRIDYRLVDAQGRTCWVEVKSVTLVEDRHALFPDAPTGRGRRHLHELAALVRAGDRAAVVFIVQRPDADRLSPNRRTDPSFAQALAEVYRHHVEMYAYTCNLTTRAMWLEREIPVVLG